MSSKATTSLNNNVAAAPKAQSGAGPAGSVAVATKVATPGTGIVDQAPAATANHQGLGTTPPATAAGFDRTVATTAGK